MDVTFDDFSIVSIIGKGTFGKVKMKNSYNGNVYRSILFRIRKTEKCTL